MKNSIELFDEMMRKSESTKPEPMFVDDSPNAEGMKPELFGVLLDGVQEIADINNGEADVSDYDVVEIRTNN